MKRPAGLSIRLDIVGIEPRLFAICKQNEQAVVQARTKQQRSSQTSETHNTVPSSPELMEIPKDQLTLYMRIVSITIDFERAYGRGVEVRVFEKSPNKLLNSLLRKRESQEVTFRPMFYVNGVKVFSGVPNSFSQLDEAIDKSFGRRKNADFRF
jgi:hypothetical protein